MRSGADAPSQISKPFGFQHLAKIERSPKHHDFHGGITQSSMVAFTRPEANVTDVQSSQRRLPPLRPKRPDESQLPTELLSPRFGVPALRQIRSADPITSPMHGPPSSSLPSSAPQVHRSTIPIRRSSKFSSQPLDDGQLPDQLSYFDQNSSRLQGDFERSAPFPHAQDHSIDDQEVKLPDRMALPYPSPLLCSHLEQVLEEPEGTLTPRPLRDSTRHPSLRIAKSSSSLPRATSHFDDLEQFLPRISLLPSIMLPRPISGGSDTIGDLSLRPFSIDCDNLNSHQLSEVVDAFDFTSSWDEDIVFCYDHGAEAHSDFDWSMKSQSMDVADDAFEANLAMEGPIRPRGRRYELSSSWASTSGSESGLLTKPPGDMLHKVPKRESVPELEEHALSHSGSCNSLLIGTPQDRSGFEDSELEIVSFPQRKSGDSFDLISPQMPPLGLKHDLDSDQLFDDLMAGFNIKQQHHATLPVLEAKTYIAPQSKSSGEKATKHAVQSTLNRISSASLDKELPPLPLQPHKAIYSDARMQIMEIHLDTRPTTEPLRQGPFEIAHNSITHRRTSSTTRAQMLPATTFNPRAMKSNMIPRSNGVNISAAAITQPNDSALTTLTPQPVSAAVHALRSPAIHKKAASADGLPLRPRASTVTSPRHSNPTYSLFPTPTPAPTNIPILPEFRPRRLTAL